MKFKENDRVLLPAQPAEEGNDAQPDQWGTVRLAQGNGWYIVDLEITDAEDDGMREVHEDYMREGYSQ